jgi:hypothetical protein
MPWTVGIDRHGHHVIPSPDIVWKIDTVSTSMSIYNEVVSSYFGRAAFRFTPTRNLIKSAANSGSAFQWTFATHRNLPAST